MSRRKSRDFFMPKHVNNEDCVCHTVKRIVEAQDEITEDDCDTSCNLSIQQLKGKSHGIGYRNNTIPFMLYCRDTCKPFVGSGVFKAPKNGAGDSFFGCVESVVFRAKEFVKGKGCCVKLELLLPVAEECGIVESAFNHNHSACSFFPVDDPVTDFLSTNICLTINLDNFIGITCLDPITPLPVKKYPLDAPVEGKKYY